MDSVFWGDLAHDLEDPESLREYITESVRIATTDAIINALDEARVSAGLSKAEVARAIGASLRECQPFLAELASVGRTS